MVGNKPIFRWPLLAGHGTHIKGAKMTPISAPNMTFDACATTGDFRTSGKHNVECPCQIKPNARRLESKIPKSRALILHSSFGEKRSRGRHSNSGAVIVIVAFHELAYWKLDNYCITAATLDWGLDCEPAFDCYNKTTWWTHLYRTIEQVALLLLLLAMSPFMSETNDWCLACVFCALFIMTTTGKRWILCENQMNTLSGEEPSGEKTLVTELTSYINWPIWNQWAELVENSFASHSFDWHWVQSFQTLCAIRPINQADYVLYLNQIHRRLLSRRPSVSNWLMAKRRYRF